MKRMIALALVLVVAAACGQATTPTTVPAGDGMAMCAPEVPDCVDVVVVEPSGDIAIPTGNAVNPEPVTEAAFIGTEGNQVLFSVWMGVEPCDVIDRVAVTETATAVDVEIFRGVGDIAATCIALAVERTVIAELEAPLGDRILTLSGIEIAR